MPDPLDYFHQLNFNTRGYEATNQVIEYLPPPGTEKKIKFCRCWQSKKFPYCDDTHKVMNEAGDSVGPFVAIIRNEDAKTFNTHRLRDKINIGETASAGAVNRMNFRGNKIAYALSALFTTIFIYKFTRSALKNNLELHRQI